MPAEYRHRDSADDEDSDRVPQYKPLMQRNEPVSYAHCGDVFICQSNLFSCRQNDDVNSEFYLTSDSGVGIHIEWEVLEFATIAWS